MKPVINYFFIFAFVIGFSTVSLSQDYAIVKKEITKSAKKPKKYEITISYPQIKGLNTESERGFNSLIKNRMTAEKDSFVTWMKDWDVTTHVENDGSYYEINDTVLFMNKNLISTHFYVNTYFESAAHPNNWSYSINYDLVKNKEIELKDIFAGGYVKFISDYCIKEITKQKREYDSTLTQPDDFTLEGAGPKEENFKVFNFTKEGFLITFPTYQVGAYVEGPQEVMMRYSDLKDFVKPGGALASFVK